jgi:hypothetical protein
MSLLVGGNEEAMRRHHVHAALEFSSWHHINLMQRIRYVLFFVFGARYRFIIIRLSLKMRCLVIDPIEIEIQQTIGDAEEPMQSHHLSD